MKKKTFIFAILILLVTSAYLYLRYSILNSPGHKPDESSSKSMLDLRPRLVARLRQLVKDGSDGLYNLSVQQVELSPVQSSVQVMEIVLTPDSTALARLDSLEKAPDNVFKISIGTLHIGGLGIDDLLSSKNIDLASVVIDSLVFELYQSKRPYNKEKRIENDSATLYQSLSKHISSLVCADIVIKKASIINHDLSKKNKISRFDNVNIHLKNLLVDSSTQYDKSRFVFAKEANIAIPNYLIRTSDSVYFFKCRSVNISAAERTLSAENIELIPRRNKQQFQKKLKAGEDIFTLKTSRLTFTGIDWWSFVNRDKMIAEQADIYNCSFKDFIDSSYQPRKLKINNYPHQAFMALKMRVSIRKIKLHNSNVTYEKLSQSSGKAGRLYFSNMNGQITNFTNIPEEIKKNRLVYCNVKTRFMRKVPTTVIFRFDMAKTKTGEFSAYLNAGAMDTSVLNPLAEPLGLFTLKKCNIKKVVADMHGSVFKVNSNFMLLYDDLYIIPLKKDKDGKGQLKKKKFTAFLANFLIVKNSNPDGGGKVRKYTYVVQRQKSPNFFSHLWKTILTGTVKTIGAPEKFAK